MRVVKMISLLICTCLLLGGCQFPGEVENQAYVLVLGVDRPEGGALELTVLVPKIGKDAAQAEDEPNAGPYLVFSASGAGYTKALKSLQLATPRQLNLSHIAMIVISDTLAQEDGFPGLISQIAQTPHLYATAQLVICDGPSKTFVEAQKTIIGTRLSSELKAMLKHYADRGFIPEASLADLFYANNSVYSDPVAIRGYLAESAPEGEAKLRIQDSPMEQRYAGTALFKDGRLAAMLDLDETALLGLIRGAAGSVGVEYDGVGYELIPEGRARKRVYLDDGQATVSLELTLYAAEAMDPNAALSVADSMKRDIEALIVRCQSLGTDPFGFADVAAGRFTTLSRWEAYGWRERFANARADVSVAIHQT